MRLLTLTEVAEALGVSMPTLRKFKAQLPGAVRVSASTRLRYREDAVQDFIRRGGCSKDAA